jgi:hypothetical protein
MKAGSAHERGQAVRDSSGVGIWGIYTERHAGVDIGGNRASLRHLASEVMGWSNKTLMLEAPPPTWVAEDWAALEEIRCVPTDDPEGRICLRRDGAALVIEGGSEVPRIIGGSIASLAEEPYSTNTVRTHIHLDPTTDPEHRYYSAESTIEVSVTLSDEKA